MNSAFSGFTISKPLLYLYLNRTIQLIGFGLFGLFLPIFFYEQFGSNIYWVIVYFGASYALSGLFLPIGGKIMNVIGLKQSMILGTIAVALFYPPLFLYQEFPLFLYLVISLITLTAFRILYWVPYHTDFANLSKRGIRGQQSSILKLLADVMGVLLPIVTGLILNYYNYNILFILATVIVLLSIIPIFKIETRNEQYLFGYFETFKELFSKKNRSMLVAYASLGGEEIVGYLIWPIFIFGLLQREYLAVGAVSALIIGATVILDLTLGRWSDSKNKKSIIKTGSFFYAVGWIIKIFVQTGFQIFIVSTYHNITGVFRNVPFNALMYERAADAGHYVDEYTLLREIALALGKVLMAGVIAILIFYFGIGIAFVATAIISLFINALD